MTNIQKYAEASPYLLEALKNLQKECEAVDGFFNEIGLDFNMNVAKTMPACYTVEEDGRLNGIISIFAPTFSEIEIGALVSPACRKKGLFKALVKKAAEECALYGYHKGLFGCDGASKPAQDVMHHMGFPVHHTEYYMEFEITAPPPASPDGLSLTLARLEDLPELTALAAAIFETDGESEAVFLKNSIEARDRKQYVFLCGGKKTGLCAMVAQNESYMIFGLGVHPSERRKGYARAMLHMILAKAMENGIKKLCLEVDSGNPNALSLYRSFGFREVKTTRYHAFDFASLT